MVEPSVAFRLGPLTITNATGGLISFPILGGDAYPPRQIRSNAKFDMDMFRKAVANLRGDKVESTPPKISPAGETVMPPEPLPGVPPFDPFPNHTCESCEKRRAGYSAADLLIHEEQWQAAKDARAAQVVGRYAAERAKAENDAKTMRSYYSKKNVEKRLAEEEAALIARGEVPHQATLATNLTHHEAEEVARLYALPEAVLAREDRQQASRLRQEAALAAYNTPEAMADRQAQRAEVDRLRVEQDRVRREEEERARAIAEAAKNKAKELLRVVIGEERYAYYLANMEFYFMTPAGHKYRIAHGYSQNVYSYETPHDRQYRGNECGYPNPTDVNGFYLPHEDLMAGQFLALMADEPHFLATSYPSGVPSWREQCKLHNTLPVELDFDVAPDGSVRPKVAVAA